MTSDAFTVNVGPAGAPVITAQPASQSIIAGGNATFTVAATGENLSYQWQTYNGAWINIPGATSASWTLAAAATCRVVVSNTIGTVTSEPATLTITPIGDGGSGGGGGAPSFPFLALLALLSALRAISTRTRQAWPSRS